MRSLLDFSAIASNKLRAARLTFFQAMSRLLVSLVPIRGPPFTTIGNSRSAGSSVGLCALYQSGSLAMWTGAAGSAIAAVCCQQLPGSTWLMRLSYLSPLGQLD